LGALAPGSLFPAFLILAVSCQLGALQWVLLVRRSGVTLPASRLNRLFWIGLFFNNFLPGSVGGDVAKVTGVAVSGPGALASSLAATILDRVLGLAALVGLALIAALALGGDRPAGLPWPALFTLGLSVAAALAGLLCRGPARWAIAVLDRLFPAELGARFGSAVRALHACRLSPWFLLRIIFLAAMVQVLRVGTHLAVAAALGIPLSWERGLELFVLVPVLGVAVMLPVTLNGLGLREFLATALFPAIGISEGDAFALQLATYLLQLVLSLAGGALFVHSAVGRYWRTMAFDPDRGQWGDTGPSAVDYRAEGPSLVSQRAIRS
jgi:hypothetical protein